MILRVNMARILNRLRQKSGEIPKWPRVKRLKSVKSEWNVWSGACGNESSCAETHAEASHPQRKTLVVRQVGDEVNKRELQIDRVLLNGRRWMGLACNDPGDTLGEETDSLP